MNENSDLKISNILHSENGVKISNSNHSLLETKLDRLEVYDSKESSLKGNIIEKNIQKTCKKKLFTCFHCNKDFSRRNSLRVHLRIHSGNKTYCCEHCGKLFAHNVTLVGHLTKFHDVNIETAHRCSVCDKIFGRKNALKIHMGTHLGYKPFSCMVCDKTFSQKVTRDGHVLTHTGKYDYSCEKCSRKFPTRYKLNYHMKSHNLPEYHCLLCLKQFTTKQDLDNHCESHKPISANNENNEHITNIMFQTDNLVNLQHCQEPIKSDIRNLLTDNEPTLPPNNDFPSALNKKFVCNFCGCNFDERKSLLHHIKMRHSVGSAIRHNCSMCERSFSQKSKLNFHLKRHTEIFLQLLWKKVCTQVPL